MKRIFLLIICSLAFSLANAQQSKLLSKYRTMALNYNHDIKAATENIAASIEMVKAAKTDLRPTLSGSASYQYIGNPTELNIHLPSSSSPLHFEGPNNQYGASVTLLQPLYTGGKLVETLKKVELQSSYATNQNNLLKSAVCYQTDVTYWSTVARKEIVSIASESKNAVEKLTRIIHQRVDLGFADPNDLLMAEVKLNEANYQLNEAQTNFEITRMSLNALLGINLKITTELDTAVVAITTPEIITSPDIAKRPELLMAQNWVDLARSDQKINDSKYLPQFYLGVDGKYQSPAYDFTPQLKPNYGIYARLSIPIAEWGKRGNESRVAKSRINMADQNKLKVEEQINLEASSAKLALSQAIDQVKLSENSLFKAKENEKRSIERYTEGKLSIMEVLQAQLFRQTAQINFVQAKLSAQNSWSELQRALYLYSY